MGIIGRLIGYPLGFIIWLAYIVTNNYALSIVIFTIITRILLFPLSVKQQKSSAAMSALGPKIEKLKKQYANNPTKMQEAQMALYEEEGYNPMSSCLPLFIQLPILYGVFDVVYRPLTHILRIDRDTINKAVEICRGIEEYAKNLGAKASTRDELYLLQAVRKPEYTDLFRSLGDDFVNRVMEFSRSNALFGFIDLDATPSLHPEVWNAGTIGLAVIPFVSGVLYLIQSIYMMVRQKKTNPDAAQAMGSMNAMFLITPVFSVMVAFNAPAGLGFYWAVSAVIGLLQSIVLNKIYTPEYVAKLIEKDKKKKKNKKKSGLMQRYQELLAQQNEQMQSQDGRSSLRKSGVSDDDEEEVKMSKSQQKEYERKIIAEARRRQAEKYGEEYIESDDD